VLVNVDKLDYCASVDNVEPSENYSFIHGNICDAQLITNTLKKFKIDTVIHIAAQTHVDNSFGNSLQFTVDNVLGTHTLLECVKDYGKIKRFIHMSTDEVYGEVDIDHEGCSEKSLLNPTNPYAATKAAAEFLCKSYVSSFGIPIIIVRGNNVYGPNQYPEKLVPKTIQHVMKKEKCEIHGTGETRRNFIHSSDVANAIDVVLHKGVVGEIYNIGSINEFSVKQIIQKIIDEMDSTLIFEDCIKYVQDRPFNDFRYAIDCKKLTHLGWKEQILFEDGLKQTIKHTIRKKSF
jgi:dTDP-glucose 4,6-dehydratase